MSRTVRSGGVRRLRATSVVVGAAICAAATFAGTAQAAPHSAPVPGSPAGALSHHAIPANAVRATQPLPKPGAYGAPFAPRSKATPDIVGGTTANSVDFPSVVGIVTRFVATDPTTGQPAFFDAFCTGTVIAPTKVLTAGHCDTDLPDGTTVVIAGRNDLSVTTSGFVDGVRSTWTDPSFNLAALNAGTQNVPTDDVAVLTLSAPMPSQFPAINLTAQGDGTPYAAGTNATIVGYGITTDGGTDVGVLHQATVPIQSDATCTSAMPGYDGSRMTCAGFPAGGVDTCHGDSGGPLLVNGVEAAITDWGASTCAAAGTFGVYERLSTYHNAITADFNRPFPGNYDFTGDGHTDLLAVDGGGNMIDFTGNGFADDGNGGFSGAFNIGSGWGGFSTLFRMRNWDGDGTEEVMAETPDGTLTQYETDGQGDFTTPNGVVIGHGFNIFSTILVVNNWTGDGLPDMLGITPDGTMVLYEGDEHGGFTTTNGTVIGHGFNIFNSILTPGTWTGDGNQALIGRLSDGSIRLYESAENAAGGFTTSTGVQIGVGFNVFSKMLTLGDWSGDDQLDMLGITGDGTMLLYDTDGHGNFINNTGITIGTGFQGLNVF